MSKGIDINDPFLAEKEAIRYVEETGQGDKFSFVTGFKHAMRLVKESDSIDLVSVSFPSDELIEERGQEFESKTYHNLKEGEKIGDFAIGAKWVLDYLKGNER